MRFRRRKLEIDNPSVLKAMKETLGRDYLNTRSDYSATYNNLKNVFGEHELFIGFFEKLFSAPELERLCNFLSLDTNKFDIEKKYNSTGKKIEIAKPEVDNLMEYFADTYEFVRQNFDESIYDAWMTQVEKITEGN